MPTITAQSIIDKAQIVLQDTTAIRWAETELLGWLNDGQREIVSLRPDAYSVIANLTLVTGTLQTIPAEGYKLLDITRNMGAAGDTPGTAIRKVPRQLLDAQVPNWHAATAAAITLHWSDDTRVPKSFYVYPPAVSGQKIEGIYSRAPTDVAAVGNTITLDDIYSNPLMDYVLYRAYSKDFEAAGNEARAVAARQSFENTLGLKAQADAASQSPPAIKG